MRMCVCACVCVCISVFTTKNNMRRNTTTWNGIIINVLHSHRMAWLRYRGHPISLLHDARLSKILNEFCSSSDASISLKQSRPCLWWYQKDTWHPNCCEMRRVLPQWRLLVLNHVNGLRIQHSCNRYCTLPALVLKRFKRWQRNEQETLPQNVLTKQLFYFIFLKYPKNRPRLVPKQSLTERRVCSHTYSIHNTTSRSWQNHPSAIARRT